MIGGGLAGAATATHLARAGREVILLERDRTPSHKVCGEFLGQLACGELDRFGVDLAALGAVPIARTRLFAGRAKAEAPLPFRAAGLSRVTLDPHLRTLAAGAGVDLRTGVRATGVTPGAVEVEGGASIAADHVIVATGKHEVRGVLRRTVAKAKDSKIGIKEHLRLTGEQFDALGPAVELHFIAGGYAGLMPVGAGAANLSIAMETGVWREHGLTPASYLDWLRSASPSLSLRLDGATRLFERPLMVSGVPYGFRLWGAKPDLPGIWRVGDQAMVTPSLTGEGMSLALGTAKCLADCLLNGAATIDYRAELKRRFGRQIAVARAFDVVLQREALHPPIVGGLAQWPALLSAGAKWSRGG